MTEDTLNQVLCRVDQNEPEPKTWYWGRDYGKDLLADLNQLAHLRGTNCLLRDGLQRAYKEISRLRKQAERL